MFSFLFQSSLYQSASSQTGALAPFLTVNSPTTDAPLGAAAGLVAQPSRKSGRSTLFAKAPSTVTCSQAARATPKPAEHPSYHLKLDFIARSLGSRAKQEAAHLKTSRIGFFCEQPGCSRKLNATPKYKGLKVVTLGSAACSRVQAASEAAPKRMASASTHFLSQLCIRW